MNFAGLACITYANTLVSQAPMSLCPGHTLQRGCPSAGIPSGSRTAPLPTSAGHRGSRGSRWEEAGAESGTHQSFPLHAWVCKEMGESSKKNTLCLELQNVNLFSCMVATVADYMYAMSVLASSSFPVSILPSFLSHSYYVRKKLGSRDWERGYFLAW